MKKWRCKKPITSLRLWQAVGLHLSLSRQKTKAETRWGKCHCVNSSRDSHSTKVITEKMISERNLVLKQNLVCRYNDIDSESLGTRMIPFIFTNLRKEKGNNGRQLFACQNLQIAYLSKVLVRQLQVPMHNPIMYKCVTNYTSIFKLKWKTKWLLTSYTYKEVSLT